MVDTLYKRFQTWSKNGSVYIISDTHFDDKEQNKLVKDWPTPEVFIANLKKVVGKNDTLIHLGDVGNPEYMKYIKGYKVLLTGNHDKGNKVYEEYFDEIYNGPLFISDKLLLSHEPFMTRYALNLHGHSHGGTFQENQNGMLALNFAGDVVGYKPINLRDIIRSGILKKVDSLHAQTVKDACKRSDKRRKKQNKKNN